MYYRDYFKVDSSYAFNLIYTEKGLVYLGINEFIPPSFVPGKKELVQLIHPRFRKDLLSYLEGKETNLAYALDIRTTAFRNKVYSALLKIPYGEVLTYKEIANQIGNPNGQRAVGQAVGSNPLPIIIPCHRVVSKTGLGGFSLGLDLKRKLLSLENPGSFGVSKNTC